MRAFETMANLATKAGVEGARFRIHAPLMQMGKAQIIQRGLSLGLDYALTHSCYDPLDRRPVRAGAVTAACCERRGSRKRELKIRSCADLPKLKLGPTIVVVLRT